MIQEMVALVFIISCLAVGLYLFSDAIRRVGELSLKAGSWRVVSGGMLLALGGILAASLTFM